MKIDFDLRRGARSLNDIVDPIDLIEDRRPFRLAMYTALFAADALAIVLAFAIANVLRFDDSLAPAGTNTVIVLLPIYLCIAADRGLYSADFFRKWRRTTFTAIRSLGAAILAVLFIGFFLHAQAEMSRIVLSIGLILGGLFLVAARAGLYRFALRATNGQPVTTLVIADGVEIATTDETIVIDAAMALLHPGVSNPQMLDRFGALVRNAERVVVACPTTRRDVWAAMLKGANVQGEIVMPELASLGSRRASLFAGQPTLVVALGPLDTRNLVLKRSFDLAVAIGVLLVSWPLLLLVAVAIRIDGPGPILFRQQRMGRGNRLFSVYKFRSMRTDLCDAHGDRSATRGDPRVTRVGRIIRATSIDELPQVLNVLLGTMSVVGPRPHALGSLAGDKLFWEVDGRYWDRHAMKPGITGLAQVQGHRGATALISDLEDRLKSDLDYMHGWTIWRDIRILFATTMVIFHRNAF